MWFNQDYENSLKYMPEVIKTLKCIAGTICDVSLAPIVKDMEDATDIVLKLNSKEIAVRVRMPGVQYRDLTVRSYRKSGKPTELQKIKAGKADLFFYGWGNQNFTLLDWMLVDLSICRTINIFDCRITKMNLDGSSGFISIPGWELAEKECLLFATNLYPNGKYQHVMRDIVLRTTVAMLKTCSLNDLDKMIKTLT